MDMSRGGQVGMLRKFLLIGLFVVLAPGSVLQIAVGTIVAAAWCEAGDQREIELGPFF